MVHCLLGKQQFYFIFTHFRKLWDRGATLPNSDKPYIIMEVIYVVVNTSLLLYVSPFKHNVIGEIKFSGLIKEIQVKYCQSQFPEICRTCSNIAIECRDKLINLQRPRSMSTFLEQLLDSWNQLRINTAPRRLLVFKDRENGI